MLAMSMQFQFVQSDGDQLAVSIDRPDTDQPCPTVFIAHGLTGQRLGKSYHFVEFARRLNDIGIACVRFDMSGCGESTGNFTALTIPRMLEDCRAVRDWACEQPWCDADALAWVGVSLGGLPAVAMDADQPGKALALWAPVYDMPRTFGATAKTGLRALLEHQGWAPYRGLKIGAPFVATLDAVNAGDCLAKSEQPVIVFHSQADEVVPLTEGRAYTERCEELGRACEWVEMTTADHDFTEVPDRERLLATTIAFFQSHLL
jgi:predicted acyl esterase